MGPFDRQIWRIRRRQRYAMLRRVLRPILAVGIVAFFVYLMASSQVG